MCIFPETVGTPVFFALRNFVYFIILSMHFCIHCGTIYSVQIVPPVYLLQTLVVFAEQENLVQTAERLGLTQPTVSRQLQQLEELFPQPLFTQQGRNKVLTAYGLALAQELKPRFLDLERVFEKAPFNCESAVARNISPKFSKMCFLQDPWI